MSMKTLVIALVAAHGLVHLIGFLRGFNIMQGKNYQVPVSRPFGLAWLLAFFLFETMAFMLFTENNYWWIFGTVAVILSQFLIIKHWKDSMFGTIPNIIITFAIVVDFGIWHFSSQLPG